MNDAIDLNDDGEAKFEIKCVKCGSTDCRIENELGCGSSGTGMYGEIVLVCKECDAYLTIYSP